VLIVHSYHQEQMEHVVEMNKGLTEALADTPCDIRYFYFDAKRHNSEQWKLDAGQKAQKLLTDFQPSVVITMDDVAQQYFAKAYAGAPAPPYFVFGGVNEEPTKYGFPADNVTGVIERPILFESIKLLQKLVPKATRLLVLADKSETTDSFMEYFKHSVLPVTVVAYAQPQTLSEWKAVLDKYHNEIDAVAVYVLRTVARNAQDQEKVPEQELIGYLNSHYHLPTVGFFDSAASAGVLCGVSVSMREQGRAAGTIAAEILSGKRPNDFTIQPTHHGRIQFNLKTAELLGIQIPYNMIKRAELVME
jgi:ABC-type uncharacterized transport system substrate-binding protein